MEPGRFNIRIYGLLIDEGKVLVTDEFRLGIMMTKFPGGGLNYGEGILDCLKREFLEELNTSIEIISHFYTTEKYFSTKLLPFESQLINVYYLVKAEKPYEFKTTEKKFDFREMVDGVQCFRWVDIRTMDKDEFTFPIDQIVAEKLKSKYTESDH